MGWKITYDGHEFREGDLTMADAQECDKVTGERWAVLQPALTPERFNKVTAWLYSRQVEMSFPEALVKVGSRPLKDAFAGFTEEDDLPTEYEDGFPPPAADQMTGG